MLLKAKVSKTWQEKQYEPFNVTLEVEQEIPDDADYDTALKTMAERLQIDISDIFAARKERREAAKRSAEAY